jgi:asparagine synthase (glutamine-hydrolysing)
MCGLTGFWRTVNGNTELELKSLTMKMADALQHRGPDDAGVWADAYEGLALGHRRLAILDLTPAGHQPMMSVSGRYVIAFNGEIYNHTTLRSELDSCGASPSWRGNSDTETLLAAFELWGVEKALQRCVGMFAFALWDQKTRALTLGRDRFGEKPLYYGWVGHGRDRAFAFSSELKALKVYPGFTATVCRESLIQYLRFLYVPAPRSIYSGIYKLEPGCLLTVVGKPPFESPRQPLRPGLVHGSVKVERWWSLARAVEVGANNPLTDEAEALLLLEDQLTHTISMQSLADVPLGAFLSGGVDSSTIVALMQRRSSRAIKTFTIGFDEPIFNEASHALAVARYLHTDHHELHVTAQMAQNLIPRLPDIYDEPFADSSQIPTFFVCQAARQHVTVALSGDAGDELFGGYNRYFWGPRLWSVIGRWPYAARQALSGVLAAMPAQGLNILSRPLGMVRPGDKLRKLAGALHNTHSADDLYRNLVSEWNDPAELVLSIYGQRINEPGSLIDDPLPAFGAEAEGLRMMYRDASSYLPDDILCKVDRAAMSCSLETRVPFLDHRVVELAWRLPFGMKVKGNISKWALRQILYNYVPRELIERPKAGFAVPVGQWIRGPLRDWAEELLNEQELHKQGYLNPTPIRQRWAEHLSGRKEHTQSLWAVLMFQAWLKAQHG